MAWFLEFEHCVFEVECMTSALDEMVRYLVWMIIIHKTKYLPPKAKSHIWNPKTKVEI